MNPWRWVDPRIQEVRLADVKAYFLHRGWQLKPNPNPNLLRFEESAERNGPPFFQMIPASEHAADFRQRIMELVTTLSELEDCHPVQILDDILNEASAEQPRQGPGSAGGVKVVRT